MSSIAVELPLGKISQWCVRPPWSPMGIEECHAHIEGSKASDFLTICCDGLIINKSESWPDYTPEGGLGDWEAEMGAGKSGREVDIDDLVCCGMKDASGGNYFIRPEDMGQDLGTTCASGKPTPLASLAATNTGNAGLYSVTAGTFDPIDPHDTLGLGDLLTASVWTTVPYCIWLNTADSSRQMTRVTVAKVNTATVVTPDFPPWFTSTGVASSAHESNPARSTASPPLVITSSTGAAATQLEEPASTSNSGAAPPPDSGSAGPSVSIRGVIMLCLVGILGIF